MQKSTIGSRIGTRRPAIWIIAAPLILALVAYLSARLASSSVGVVRLVAQTVTVILASLAGALAGFLIPMAPLARQAIGEAFWAGIFATLGTLGGMSFAETLMARLDRR